MVLSGRIFVFPWAKCEEFPAQVLVRPRSGDKNLMDCLWLEDFTHLILHMAITFHHRQPAHHRRSPSPSPRHHQLQPRLRLRSLSTPATTWRTQTTSDTTATATRCFCEYNVDQNESGSGVRAGGLVWVGGKKKRKIELRSHSTPFVCLTIINSIIITN